MEQYIIKGGSPLVGEVEIGGAKNAALAIIAAAIMTDETVIIDNLPDVRDINVLLDAMQEIGADVVREDRHTAKINGGAGTILDGKPVSVRQGHRKKPLPYCLQCRSEYRSRRQERRQCGSHPRSRFPPEKR